MTFTPVSEGKDLKKKKKKSGVGRISRWFFLGFFVGGFVALIACTTDTGYRLFSW